MKIKLERAYGLTRDEGEMQKFFGVPFICKNRGMGKDKILSEWFADIPAKEAKEMADLGRVELIKD